MPRRQQEARPSARTVPGEGWARELDARLGEVDHARSDLLPDARARAIAAAVDRLGRGGRQGVADHLGISLAAIDQALRRARNGSAVDRGVPWDLLLGLLAIERDSVAALPVHHWRAIASIVRSIAFDDFWLEQPGALLAQEVLDAPPEEVPDRVVLAAACRVWSRTQAIAVVDCCLRGLWDRLPTLAAAPSGPGDHRTATHAVADIGSGSR